MQIEASVIIPNWNGARFLSGCLDSLGEQAGPGTEIIVIDNGSADDSLEILGEYPGIVLIRNTENKGFAAAVNQGFAAMRGRYAVLLNNDTVVQPGWLDSLINEMETHPRAFSAASLMLRMDDPDRVDDAGDNYTVLGWGYKRRDGKPAARERKPSRIFSACGGAAIYRKEALETIGGMDEAFFAYMEDMDLGWRALSAGWENRYCPEARVLHIGSATSGSKYNAFKVRLAARNNLYILYKNIPLWMGILLSPFLLLGFLIKWLFFAAKGFGAQYCRGFGEAWAGFGKLQRHTGGIRHIGDHFRVLGMMIADTCAYIVQKLTG
jgi:GT2 family glycosyltransferase